MEYGRWPRGLRQCRCLVPSLSVVLFFVCLPGGAGVFRGVVEGDTDVSIFINGQFMPRDQGLPVLPLNSERRVNAMESTIIPVFAENPLNEGDILAVEVVSTRPRVVSIENVMYETNQYTSFASFIAAFEDGTMTSSDWLCNNTAFEFDLDEKPAAWMLSDFDDSAWPQAIEHDLSCCPWRDPKRHWDHLNAKWITPLPYNASAPFPTNFLCRYRVPSNTTRLPATERALARVTAPVATVTRLEVGTSLAQVWYNINRRGRAYCGIIDARYLLRPPSPLELISWGESEIADPNERQWFTYATSSPYGFSNVSAMQDGWLLVPKLDQCKRYCFETLGCVAITWYDEGYDYATGARCKMMAELDPGKMDTVSSPFQRMTTMYIEESVADHDMSIVGMLLPGTIYHAYCVAEEVSGVNRKHSTWEAVKAAVATERTEGCLDCGARDPPSIDIFGGWASRYEITVVVNSDNAGRMFCIALPWGASASTNASSEISSDSIRQNGFYNILIVGGQTIAVSIRDLEEKTVYEIFCLAESDGGVMSSKSAIARTRRLWSTESENVPISQMSISHAVLDGTKEVRVVARMSERGYLWCMIEETLSVIEGGVPGLARIKVDGLRQKVEDTRLGLGGLFPDLHINKSYELYCTGMASDFSNESVPGGQMKNPFPSATILRGQVILDSIRVQVVVDRGPSRVVCKALPWSRRPYEAPPLPPAPEDFDVMPYETANVLNIRGATIELLFEFLVTGSWHDLYCYAEEIQEIPPGSAPPPKKGMTPDAIVQTRLKLLTNGPQYSDSGWHCVAGNPCNISNVKGEGLSRYDQVLVRADRCPGPCTCGGIEDQWHKGAECSSVEQGPDIFQPPPGSETDPAFIDRFDPRGPWCYVMPGSCDDAVPSNHSRFLVSWTACSYNKTAGRPGSGPPGFANEGVGTTRTGPVRLGYPMSPGDAFYWSSSPLVAPGKPYSLCWCNGTSSSCFKEADFRLSIGILHVSGPSALQLTKENACIAGKPCVVQDFHGHGLFDESRLAVLPLTDEGCEWTRATPLDYPGVVGFPQVGVSNLASDGGRSYSWGGTPVMTIGGVYLLCWCGAVPADDASHRRRTTGRGTLPRTLAYTCSPTRPEDGAGYLAPAGMLGVIGPGRFNGACTIGVECSLTGVPGYGLQVGDALAVLKSCGDETPPPPGWFKGPGSEMPEGWQEGGWLTWGAPMSEETLLEIGAPVPKLLASLQGKNATPRGVWGFPNRGISAGPTDGVRVNGRDHYRWGTATWAFSGDYNLCWCAKSRSEPCFLPEHFRVDIGILTVTGPAVLPEATQVHKCIRGRRCDIVELQGSISTASQIFIADSVCGSDTPTGAPRNGMSLPSPDGKFYSFAGDPITTTPGKYRLCYCPTIGRCDGPEDFSAFAGILAVKGPVNPQMFWFCPLNAPCNISGVEGEGLHQDDRVKLMPVCGSGTDASSVSNKGLSYATYQLGTDEEPMLRFTLPPASVGGQFRVCYCPAEAFCIGGEDFFVDVGQVDIGGPDTGIVYLCYSWRPCTLDFVGRNLHDGDRLLVAPGGTDCLQTHAEPPQKIAGWPLGGVSLPATGDGATLTWGKDALMENYVLATPGVYTLCWCSARQRQLARDRQQQHSGAYSSADNDTVPFLGCTVDGPFDVLAGAIRIGTYREYQYLTREPDPEKRGSGDFFYGWALAAPLPLLFALFIFAGYRKMSSRSSRAEPEAPPLFKSIPTFAGALQEKAHNMSEVKQVLDTRVGVKQQSMIKEPMMLDVDVPNFMIEDKDKFNAGGLRRMSALQDGTIVDESMELEVAADAGEYASRASWESMRSGALDRGDLPLALRRNTAEVPHTGPRNSRDGHRHIAPRRMKPPKPPRIDHGVFTNRHEAWNPPDVHALPDLPGTTDDPDFALDMDP